MICICLNGGLGNQLFQYAAGRALALRHSTELLFDLSLLEKKGRDTHREFELFHFNCVGRIATKKELHRIPKIVYFPNLFYKYTSWRIYREHTGAYNPSYLYLSDNTYLVGYWQSFRYFNNISSYLALDFNPKNSLSSTSALIQEKINISSSVAIHIRRGDYITNPSASRTHGILPISYYYKALNDLYNRISNLKIFIFSDDPEWCKSQLLFNNNEVIYITNNTREDSWQDLILMSKCRHHIIANSSFSWWGAWLADQKMIYSERYVYAPQNWFINMNNQNINDRIPPHWIRI